jgi:hypothetical protein
MRQVRRAYVAIGLNRPPERAGPRPSEKPDSAMNMTTANRPQVIQAAQNGARSAG